MCMHVYMHVRYQLEKHLLSNGNKEYNKESVLSVKNIFNWSMINIMLILVYIMLY